MKNILIFINTPYHIETALSIYKSIELLGHQPYFFLDYNPKEEWTSNNDFELKKLANILNLNIIENLNGSLEKNFFYKMIVITADYYTPYCRNFSIDIEKMPPINYNVNMQKLKDRVILIYHKDDYSNNLKFANQYFINPIGISINPKSQKFGMDFIYQTENIVSDYLPEKTSFNEKIEFLCIGRFVTNTRYLEFLKNLDNLDMLLNKKIKILFMGSDPEQKDFFKIKEYKNIQFEMLYNISQIDFYKKVKNCDFILNLSLAKKYLNTTFSSNVSHIVSFSKPNISLLMDNIYNYPSFSINPEDVNNSINDQLLKASNLDWEEYSNISNHFNKIKQNHRLHNKHILNTIL